MKKKRLTNLTSALLPWLHGARGGRAARPEERRIPRAQGGGQEKGGKSMEKKIEITS